MAERLEPIKPEDILKGEVIEIPGKDSDEEKLERSEPISNPEAPHEQDFKDKKAKIKEIFMGNLTGELSPFAEKPKTIEEYREEFIKSLRRGIRGLENFANNKEYIHHSDQMAGLLETPEAQRIISEAFDNDLEMMILINEPDGNFFLRQVPKYSAFGIDAIALLKKSDKARKIIESHALHIYADDLSRTKVMFVTNKPKLAKAKEEFKSRIQNWINIGYTPSEAMKIKYKEILGEDLI